MNNKGLYIALLILLLWSSCLFFLLNYFTISWTNPLTYIFFFLQTHLYTGIFITAHDAMHGTVSSNKKLNNSIGWLCTNLFAFNSYRRLYKKHHEHHNLPATEHDPDYHPSNYFVWYFNFSKNYATIWQFVLMGIAYNLLKLVFPMENVLLYWMFPAVASTLQLFTMGTYFPHRKAPDNEHKARSQKKNHVWAFVSCYFFGYHYEHHNHPNVPWWKLHLKKE